jgi:hypothetical protein
MWPLPCATARLHSSTPFGGDSDDRSASGPRWPRNRPLAPGPPGPLRRGARPGLVQRRPSRGLGQASGLRVGRRVDGPRPATGRREARDWAVHRQPLGVELAGSGRGRLQARWRAGDRRLPRPGRRAEASRRAAGLSASRRSRRGARCAPGPRPERARPSRQSAGERGLLRAARSRLFHGRRGHASESVLPSARAGSKRILMEAMLPDWHSRRPRAETGGRAERLGRTNTEINSSSSICFFLIRCIHSEGELRVRAGSSRALTQGSHARGCTPQAPATRPEDASDIRSGPQPRRSLNPPTGCAAAIPR